MAPRTPRHADDAPSAQLSLFAPAPRPAAPEPTLEAEYATARALAARLPPRLAMGTSSWSFPGWRGIVYARAASTSALARDGLPEYARHPLLRTVGVDRGYYAPIPDDDLRRYAAQLPAGFPCCLKAPEALTTPVHLGHGRGPAGRANPDFLSADRFRELMGDGLVAHFREHTGAVLLEFPPVPAAHRLHPQRFAEALDGFLAALPPELPYAVELRDRALLTPAYAAVLAARRVAHVYNYHGLMPTPGAQRARVPLDPQPFVVVRLLLRPGTRYDDRKSAFAPFDRLHDVDDAMRDEVAALCREAAARDRVTYVLVNNKAEGCAPLTIRALAERLGA